MFSGFTLSNLYIHITPNHNSSYLKELCNVRQRLYSNVHL